MKRKLILPLLIITSTIAITACGSDNKWDAEASSIQYGEIDENVADDNESVESTEEKEIHFTGHTEYTPEEEPEKVSTESTNETEISKDIEDNVMLNDFDNTITEDKGYSKLNINNIDVSGKLTMDTVLNTIGLKEVSYSNKMIDTPYYQFTGTGYAVKVSDDVFGFTEGEISIDLDDNNEITAVAVSDFSHADDMKLIWMNGIAVGSTKEEVEAIAGPAVEFETDSKIYYTYEDSVIKVSIEYEKDFESGNYLIEEMIFMYK